MKNSFAILGLAATLLALPALAEKADHDKPMNIDADKLRYDDLNQQSVFTGHVLLTKGTIVIRGEQLSVRQDPDGSQHALVTAAPNALAFFRQKREALDEFIEGEGETITYDGAADTVTFTRRAQMRRFRGTQLADQISGAVIVYENLSDIFRVDGNNSVLGSDSKVVNSGGRVHAMLTPKPAASAASAAP